MIHLARKQVAARLGVSRRHFDLMVAQGKFPKPTHHVKGLNRGRLVYREQEVFGIDSYKILDVARMLGMKKSALEHLIRHGRFPRPTYQVGDMTYPRYLPADLIDIFRAMGVPLGPRPVPVQNPTRL